LRELLWDRREPGARLLQQARQLGAQVDDRSLGTLLDQLIVYEIEYGARQARQAIERLAPALQSGGSAARLRWLKAARAMSAAARSYRQGKYARVRGEVLHAILHNPGLLADRGVVSMLARSLFGRAARP
jgi:hypothetical protein